MERSGGGDKQKAEGAGNANASNEISKDLKYDTAMQDFEHCLVDVTSHGQTLEDFRLEFEKLLAALEKSNEGENKLLSKTAELKQEIETNRDQTSKVRSEDDELQLRKRRLQDAIERNQNLSRDLHEAEAETKRQIEKVSD
jgi:DNA repair exonuclease SbcCD ATPase subunit